MSNNGTGEIHLHTSLEHDQWTKRQEEVNALMVKAVGVEGWRTLAVQPQVRAEVRARLDAHNAAVAKLQAQIAATKADFAAGLKEYLAPIAQIASAEEVQGDKPEIPLGDFVHGALDVSVARLRAEAALAGQPTGSFADGLKPGAATPTAVAGSKGTGFKQTPGGN